MNQHERPDGDGNTKPLELAGKANAFLTKRVAEVAEADPDLEDLVLNVLSLASEEEFRKKIPVIAVELCRIGAWAYPGGRKHRKKGKKQGLGKRRMKRFLPDVQPYDLIDHAWNRVLADIQEHREMSEFRTISSVQLFITRFTRKMEDHLKALAQREASHAGVTDKKSINEASTVIDVDQFQKFGDRKLIRKVLTLLESHPQHRETIRRRFFEDLTPKMEREKYGGDIAEINRRREAAVVFLKRNIPEIKG